MNIKIKIASSLLLVPLFFPSLVSAESLREVSLENRVNRVETRRENIQNKLDDVKLKVCQRHEENITKRMSNLTELVTMMVGKFDTTAQRVEEYYTTKVVPSGKTVTNYDALVADIQTKKTDVQTALTEAQTDSTGFKCDSDDPKSQLTQYRVDMQAVKKALQAYRVSIKNLIVAVKSVAGTTESEK